MVEEALLEIWHNRYKELELNAIGFMLYKPQVEAIQTIFFQYKNMLLFAKTSLDKILIFKLFLFFTIISKIVLTLITLKLL